MQPPHRTQGSHRTGGRRRPGVTAAGQGCNAGDRQPWQPDQTERREYPPSYIYIYSESTDVDRYRLPICSYPKVPPLTRCAPPVARPPHVAPCVCAPLLRRDPADGKSCSRCAPGRRQRPPPATSPATSPALTGRKWPRVALSRGGGRGLALARVAPTEGAQNSLLNYVLEG